MATKRIEIKGGHFVRFMSSQTARDCVDMLLGEKRKRITRASLDAAELEARKLITQIASGCAHGSR